MTKERLWTRSFIQICGAQLIMFALFYFMLTVLPLWLKEELNASLTTVSWMMTLFLLAALVIRPFAPRWMERFSMKGVTIGAYGLFALCLALYPFVHSIPALYALRIVHGIAFGLMTTVNGTIVSFRVARSRQGEGMGYFVLAMNMAMVVGPIAGLYSYSIFPITTIFMTCAALLTLTAATFLTMTEQMAVVPTKQTKWIDRPTLPFAISASLYGFAYAGIMTFLSLYTKELGIDNGTTVFFTSFALILMVTRPITGPIYDRSGAKWLLLVASAFLTSGFVCLATAHSLSMLVVSGLLVGFGWGTLIPTLQTMAMQRATVERKALATATFYSVFDFGLSVGAFMLGLFVERSDFSTLFYVCAALVVVASFICTRLVKPFWRTAEKAA